MIYYLIAGLFYSFFHNYSLFFFENEQITFKIWSYFYIALFFPLAILINLLNSSSKTQKVLDAMVDAIVGLIER